MMLSQIDDRQLSFHDLEGSEMTPEQVAAEQARVAKAQAEREKAIKRADAQLHQLITLIGKETQKQPWLSFMENFLKLNKEGGLRSGVKKRFLEAVKSGPFQDIRFRVEQELGIERPKARPGGPSPLRGKGAKAPKPPRHVIDKRRQDNRDDRLKLQTQKGASGSKSEPGSGKKAKGGKQK